MIDATLEKEVENLSEVYSGKWKDPSEAVVARVSFRDGMKYGVEVGVTLWQVRDCIAYVRREARKGCPEATNTLNSFNQLLRIL